MMKNAFSSYKYSENHEVRAMTPLEAYFERIKANLRVEYSSTLFEPTFADLQKSCKEQRCLLCGCKLYLMRNKPMYYCKSKKHKTRYIIRKEKLEEIANL